MPDDSVQMRTRDFINRLSPWQFIVLLLGFVALGGLSGGTGHLAFDSLAGLFGSSSKDVATDLTTAVNNLNETLSQQQRAVIDLNETLEQQRELLNRTRCEIRAIRDDFDWLECWSPEERE